MVEVPVVYRAASLICRTSKRRPSPPSYPSVKGHEPERVPDRRGGGGGLSLEAPSRCMNVKMAHQLKL